GVGFVAQGWICCAANRFVSCSRPPKRAQQIPMPLLAPRPRAGTNRETGASGMAGSPLESDRVARDERGRPPRVDDVRPLFVVDRLATAATGVVGRALLQDHRATAAADRDGAAGLNQEGTAAPAAVEFPSRAYQEGRVAAAVRDLSLDDPGVR